MRMVFAGEVFSEQWRDLVSARVGIADPVTATASLYGTADAGVLANETPRSISIRRFLAARPELARQVLGGVTRYQGQHNGARSRYWPRTRWKPSSNEATVSLRRRSFPGPFSGTTAAAGATSPTGS